MSEDQEQSYIFFGVSGKDSKFYLIYSPYAQFLFGLFKLTFF